jgi:hypothetical protein
VELIELARLGAILNVYEMMTRTRQPDKVLYGTPVEIESLRLWKMGGITPEKTKR